MLQIFRHRVNTVTALAQIPVDVGIEFDLRSDGDRVIVTHDPFTDGPTIEEFFPRIGPRPCIFNVKCEGIEARVLQVAAAHKIEDFFFLDLSIPAAIKLVRQGERRIAVRYSEFEPAEAALAWVGRAGWVWVDCFTHYPDDPGAWARLASAFKLCLVSPELQGHDAPFAAAIRTALGNRRYDAVCTKVPEQWTTA